MRGPLAWPAVPAMRTAAERFEDLALGALDLALQRLQAPAGAVELAVEDVPARDPEPWEDGVPLARALPGGRGVPDRVVLYRRPLERAVAAAPPEDREVELGEVVLRVLTEQVARLRGIDPGDLDLDDD